MRKPLVIALGALVVAGAGLALAPMLLLTSRLSPPAPQARERAPDPAARPLTTIAIPVELPMRAIVDLANAKGPASVSGTEALPHLKQSAETSIAWTLSRSAFAGTAEDGQLVLTATLTGGASLRGRSRPTASARGGPSRTLPRAFTESLDVAADIRVTSGPKLNAGWRIAPGFEAIATLRQGEARVADLFTLDLRGTLQPRIAAALKQELDTAGARIARDPFLETAARATWDRLCTSIEIGAGGGQGAPSLWLDLEPKGLTAGSPAVSAEAVTIPLTARGSASLSDVPRVQAECEPFPDRLGPSADAAAQGGTIALGAGLDLAALSEAATAEMRRQNPLEFEGRGAELDTVDLAALDDRVLVAVSGRFRQPGLLGASAEGRLYFLAQPLLDRDGAALSLGATAIAPASAEALAAPGEGALSALGPEIARRLGLLRFDLKPQLDRLRSWAGTAAEGLTRPTPLGIARITVGEVRLVGIHPNAQGLRLRAEAEGALALRPVALLP